MFLELMRMLPVPFNMVVLIVLIGSLAGVITTVAKQLRKYASHRQELDFKRELLDRGFGVDDIERLIRAQAPVQDELGAVTQYFNSTVAHSPAPAPPPSR